MVLWASSGLSFPRPVSARGVEGTGRIIWSLGGLGRGTSETFPFLPSYACWPLNANLCSCSPKPLPCRPPVVKWRWLPAPCLQSVSCYHTFTEGQLVFIYVLLIPHSDHGHAQIPEKHIPPVQRGGGRRRRRKRPSLRHSSSLWFKWGQQHEGEWKVWFRVSPRRMSLLFLMPLFVCVSLSLLLEGGCINQYQTFGVAPTFVDTFPVCSLVSWYLGDFPRGFGDLFVFGIEELSHNQSN